MRSTQLEVNLNSIKNNVRAIYKMIGGEEVIAIVKADAYGLGSVQVTKALIESGVSFFSVALLEEAQVLRENAMYKKILLSTPFIESEIPDLIYYSVIPTIVDYERAKILNDYAHKKNEVIPIHIKVDTGMGRLGVKITDAFEFIKKCADLKNLKIEGIYSHFPSSDIPDREFTKYQISLFSHIIKQCQALPIPSFIAHLANSGGIINFKDSYFDGVRPGIMLYGCYPSPHTMSQIELSKVITLKTQIISVKEISEGEGVSYGRTFIAKQKTKIAILPIGYADGYSTLLSNFGEVIIQNEKVPVIGKVCMDYTIVDVTSLNDIKIGDEAILIGGGITEEEIALKTGLIPYEILTSISKRVPRVYI